MIGHRTPRHQSFGWAAARLDDLVNLPASRLSGAPYHRAAALARDARPAAPGAACGGTRGCTARRTPAGPRPPWRARSASGWRDRGSMAGSGSTTLGWASDGRPRPWQTSGAPWRSTARPAFCSGARRHGGDHRGRPAVSLIASRASQVDVTLEMLGKPVKRLLDPRPHTRIRPGRRRAAQPGARWRSSAKKPWT
jgi:hypothetical protein